MAKKKSSSSLTRSVGTRTIEQLAAMGIVFLLAPYVQAQLAPVRDKIYGGPTPNQPTGTVPVPAVADVNAAPTQSTVGGTPGSIINITPPLAPTGDQPAPTTGAPAIAPNAGPLGGLFLGS